METAEILEIVNRGEDSKHQFKENVTNVNSLAGEMVAFSNSGGGYIFIGVSDAGDVTGLTNEDVGRINQLVSNAASQSVRPPINPQTENIAFPEVLVMVVHVAAGISKPYMDKDGVIWIKNGADKRKATSREEIQRMYQGAGLIHGDEIPANGITVSDLDLDYFREYFRKQFIEELDAQDLPLPVILRNMNLMNDEVFNIAGALIFSKAPQNRLPVFMVKGVSYPGTDIHVSEYRDSQDIIGKLEVVFKEALSFITRNIRHIQADQNVNSPGELEIPKIALEELLANALVHRDYFITAPIRIFIFDDRIEIISPGHLPNNLTIENIKSGNSNIRNPILASFASKILPYRGLGNGIRRALNEYPDIDFVDDREGNQFVVIIRRRMP
jgi:ATP-dependent DNA helicase RecG